MGVPDDVEGTDKVGKLTDFGSFKCFSTCDLY